MKRIFEIDGYFRGQSTAVSADDGLNVASTLLGSSVISSLGWHPDKVRAEGMYVRLTFIEI